ncbi:MAG: rod shape-determining protein RodA [Rhodothermales bacterium]|nr:rod shape-determining protein RodA [Rhodothermales bacterium]
MTRTWYRNIDWSVIAAWAALVACGLTAIYSATHGPASEFLLQTVQQNFDRQLMWFGISAGVFVGVLFLPARFIEKSAFGIYAATIALLVATLLFGREVNGAKAWLYIGPFGLQTAELAKIGTLLAVAKYLSMPQVRSGKLRWAALAVGILLLPVAIIILQNETGTALVFLALTPIVLFWGGVPLPLIALMLAPGVAGYLAVVQHDDSAPIYVLIFALLFTAATLIMTRDKWYTAAAAAFTGVFGIAAWIGLTKILQPHQVDRIVAFTNPEAFRLTTGFHVIQSKAAVGSGGLFGKGFMQGTQTQLAFIPEQSTDFIFTVIAEEFGFLGTMVVLALFAFLIIRLAGLGSWAAYTFPKVVAAGVAGLFLIHVLINVGMTIGVMPVIGIPLPLVSYGGSALLANTLLVALSVVLFARRDEFSIYRS